MSFLDLTSLGLNSSASELYDEWLAFMQSAYPDYVPGAANLENIDAQATAALMADVAQVGVVVPSAIARAFGTKLFQVPYLQGQAAITVIQVTAVDTTGYTLPAGTDLTLGSIAFVTQTDLTIPNGQTTGTVNVVAAVVGVDSNGATNPAEFVSIVDWVASVTALAAASGGVDPEDDTDYQNRLVGQLQLLAPRPITAADYATMALSFQPAEGTDQEEVGRATALDGYVEGSASFTVTTVNTNATVTVTAAPAAGVTAAPGATITGTGIPANTIVISSTSSTITMSNAATASASGVTATLGGTLGNERTVTTAITLADGTSTNSDTKTAVQAFLASFRELNFVVDVIDPTYTPVYVTVSVHLFSGFDPTSTQTAIQTAIINFLSPNTFGLPPFGNQQAWLAGTVIYASELESVIQNAASGAVQYIADGSLKIGTAPSPTSTSSLTIPGPIALPTSTTSTVPVPTLV